MEYEHDSTENDSGHSAFESLAIYDETTEKEVKLEKRKTKEKQNKMEKKTKKKSFKKKKKKIFKKN